MLVDTHAHVNFSAFKDEYKPVLERALNMGMIVINVGTQIDTSREAVKVAEEFGKNVYAVIGIHPVHTYQQVLDEEETHFKTRAEKFEHDVYFELGQNPKVVGIGECGLDYYRLPEGMDMESVKQSQKEAFIGQIRLAKQLNKALVIHCRPSVGSQDAYEDILKILDAELSEKKSPPIIGGVALYQSSVRGRGGKLSRPASRNSQLYRVPPNSPRVPCPRRLCRDERNYHVRQNRQHGTGRKNSSAGKNCARNGLSLFNSRPAPGQKNEPSYVQYVAQKVAELKGVSLGEVVKITSKSASDLFQITI